MDAEASQDSARPAGPCQDCLRNRASLEGLNTALDAKVFFWIGGGAFGLGLVAFGAGIAAIIIARRGNGQWTWTG